MDNDPQDNEFIRQYDAFVRGVVKHTRAQLGIEGDAEDLVAYAFEGLLEARRRFDPARGVPFKSFAYYRVRGAVLDGVRAMAYLPRRAYARLKASEAMDIESEPVGEARAQQADASASDVEGSLRAIDGILGNIAAAYCTAASAQEEDSEFTNPEQSVLSRERRERVRRALESAARPRTPAHTRSLHRRSQLRRHRQGPRAVEVVGESAAHACAWSHARRARGIARVQFAPFIAFFVSGASSLIFQLIWSRLLHHVFGSSSVAISSVVSVFMGGLALGAWLFGRVADRICRPLLVYAWAEFGVGLFALFVPVLVSPEGFLAQVNAFLHQRFESGSLGLMLARFACIAPVLIVPTTLMGSTLPLLARHFVGSAEHASTVSRRVGALYAVNTLGAVSGVFLAGFVLMPKFGVSTANRVAVLMNFVLAAGIFALRRRLGEGGERSAPDTIAVPAIEAHDEPENAPFPARVRTAAAVAFAASGFCSLLYEVVWSRALVNTIGGSVYAFALILMTFLTGIAAGSATAARCLSAGRARRTGAFAFCGAVAVAGALPFGVQFGLWAWALASAVGAGLISAAVALRARSERQRALFAIDTAVDARALEVGDLVPVVPALLPAFAALVVSAEPALGPGAFRRSAFGLAARVL